MPAKSQAPGHSAALSLALLPALLPAVLLAPPVPLAVPRPARLVATFALVVCSAFQKRLRQLVNLPEGGTPSGAEGDAVR